MMNAKFEVQAYNEEQRHKYPLGTVLWVMSGKPSCGKVYWSPMARSIEQHPEKGGFMFDAVPMVHGSSWNNIGNTYFLSREECIAAWGDKPRIEDDDRPVEKQEHPHPGEYGKRIIWHDDSINALTITAGHTPVPTETLSWRMDRGAKHLTGNGNILTLNEIRDQIWKKHGKTIIEVRVESPLSGVIYQVGNYTEDYWHEHAKTRGYA
jgi:hypothetical protein